jgi:hypothetical protein
MQGTMQVMAIMLLTSMHKVLLSYVQELCEAMLII